MRRVLVLFALTLTACGPATVVPLASRTPMATATAVPVAPTPTAGPMCPKPSKIVRPVFPSSMDPMEDAALKGLETALLDYLNEGGDPSALPVEMKRDAESTLGTRLDLRIEPVDLSGDGVNELIVMVDVWVQYAHDSAVWVFACETGKYVETAYLAGGYFDGGAKIVRIEDLNGDGRPEAIIHETWAGSGCLENYMVIGWLSHSTIDYMGGGGEDFPCGTELLFGPKDPNGKTMLLFKGKTDARYEAPGMIQQEYVDTYAVTDAGVYAKVSHTYLPSPYRLIALYKAQEALDAGDLQLATQLYDKAAHDDTLLDVSSLGIVHGPFWISPLGPTPKELGSKDHPKEYQTAFALFRLTAIYLLDGNQPAANAILDELGRRFPAASYGHEFTVLANLLDKEVASGKNVSLACDAVTAEIEKDYPLLQWHFDWTTWTVFYYTNESLCPGELVLAPHP